MLSRRPFFQINNLDQFKSKSYLRCAGGYIMAATLWRLHYGEAQIRAPRFNDNI
jgi:hypothetical protein